MMCYLGAPISLGLRAGEGTPTLCSKECHGSQPAGAAEKEEIRRGQSVGRTMAIRPTIHFMWDRFVGVETDRRGWACSGHQGE